MKKYASAVFCVFAASICWGYLCAQEVAPKTEPAAAPEAEAKGTPKIACDQPEFDFGERDNSESVEHAFVVRNDGDGTLEILKTRTSCGCTVASVSERSIAPGKTAEIKARLSLKGRRGGQRKTVTVESNDAATPRLTLTIKGTAVSSIEMNPPRLFLGQVVAGQPIEKTVMIKSLKAPFNITKYEPLNTNVIAKLETILEGKEYKLTVTIPSNVKKGYLSTRVRMYTDSAAHRILDLPISGNIIGELAVAPEKIIMTNRNGLPETRYVIVRPGQVKEFEVLEVEPPTTNILVKVYAMAGQGYRIQLNNVVASDEINGKILKIKTDVDAMSEIEIPFEYRK